MSGICGIAGKGIVADKCLIKKMTNTLIHRGLDGEGYYVDKDVCLGVRISRISTHKVDLPFANKDGSVHLVYDGEIYNSEEVKIHLERKGCRFHEGGDAEKIMCCYEEYGPEFVSRLDGAFSLAIWDSQKKILILARDRVGEKILHYSLLRGTLLFGSEIKPLLQYGLKREVNIRSVHNLFSSFLHIPGPETILNGIDKLPPGHILIWENGEITLKQYWDVNFACLKKPERIFKEEGLTLLKESLRKRLTSKNKVYALLSGGIDSSAVVALLSEVADKEVNTLTASFGGDGFWDESKYADLVADKFGTNHKSISVRSDVIKNLPEIIWYLDDLCCGAAWMTYYPLLKFAKKNKYSLVFSGLGGEQISGSTQKALYSMSFFKKCFPRRIRKIIPPLHFEKYPKLTKFLNILHGSENIFDDYRELTGITSENDLKGLYTKEARSVLKGWKTSKLLQKEYNQKIKRVDAYKKAGYLSLKTTIPDLNLARYDGLASACSLIPRSPFVDYKLVEFSMAIPTKFNLKGLSEVLFFKKMMDNKLPEVVLKRKKHPGIAPLSLWTKEYEGVLEHIFSELGKRGYFKKNKLLSCLSRPNKRLNDYYQIWTLAHIEIWHQIFIDKNILRIKNGLHL